MEQLKRLIREVHRRSLWQVLAIYVIASVAVFETVEALTSGLGLPEWFPAFALILLLIGLPIVLATAFIQQGTPDPAPADPTLLPISQQEPGTARARPGEAETSPARRLFTWRNAIAGGVLAFALWGVVATGWLVLADRDGEEAATATAEDGVTAKKKLVVLPFENLGPPDDEYFADGITDAITARLASLGGLGVTSRQSAVQFEDSEKTAREIGEALGVQYILEGTVQRERPGDPSSRVRVIPQLVRIADDTHLWAATYDEEMNEVFRVQSEIAERVARALDLTLLDSERRSLGSKPTDDIEAYEYYLRGNEYYSRYLSTAEDLRTAARMYERAIELDPEFAEAYAGAARSYVFLRWNYGEAETLPEARAALDEAVRLGADLPEVRLARGQYLYYGQRDYEAALEQMEQLRDRQPSNAEAVGFIGWLFRRLGRWEEATAQVERALELDPLRHSWYFSLGETYRMMRRYEAAERYIDRAIELAPDIATYRREKARLRLNADGDRGAALAILQDAARRIHPIQLIAPSATLRRVLFDDFRETLTTVRPGEHGIDTLGYHFVRAQLAGHSDRPEVARAHYDSARVILEDRVRNRSPDFAPHSSLGIVYAHLGRGEDAVREGERSVETIPISRDAYAGTDRVISLVRIYVVLGEYDAAIDRIEQVLTVPSDLSISLLRVDPLYDPLRDHPRFQALLEKYESPGGGSRGPG